MSLAAARPLRQALRQPAVRRATARRFESTTTTAGATSKASQGLSRVTSAAGPALGRAAGGLARLLGRVGGRTGRAIGFVERQVPVVLYYSRVAVELSKLVYRGQSMAPPPAATFQSYFRSAWARARRPAALLQSAATATATPQQALQQVRGISRAQLVAGGVLLAECLGFFTVGEILGRFKLIGYHGDAHPGEHH